MKGIIFRDVTSFIPFKEASEEFESSQMIITNYCQQESRLDDFCRYQKT